ncbi:hypothetical protein CDAR_207661 [Caerostris darwini]|uniref:Uncharacterized protein n=1 Tax=Caerostris darwini TaxID=1538125 RepID=A0AAV4WSD0_9ARAC|nr:hypothetical protein CDAR_207661 [Caerostris darwini]
MEPHLGNIDMEELGHKRTPCSSSLGVDTVHSFQKSFVFPRRAPPPFPTFSIDSLVNDSFIDNSCNDSSANDRFIDSSCNDRSIDNSHNDCLANDRFIDSSCNE